LDLKYITVVRLIRGLHAHMWGVMYEKFDKDKLSFFEIKGIVKKYGYKSGNLMHYVHSGCSMQSV
jgi:hypothetical protein